jgi:hypothetical protein
MPYVRSKEDAEFVVQALEVYGPKACHGLSAHMSYISPVEGKRDDRRLYGYAMSFLDGFIAGMYAERDRAEREKQP